MKKIKACRLGCGRSVSKSLAYHAKVEREIINPITGEVKFINVTGPICPICAEKCGYKVSKKKLEKIKGGDES